MRKRRAARAAELGIDVSAAVIDGHAKLTRRVCSVPRVCLLPCPRLGLITLMGCPETPRRGAQLCTKHWRVAQQPPAHFEVDGMTLQAVKWKAAIGAHVHELYRPFLGKGDGDL
eukprot:105258-Lingulodinium_polyedra.AAC.1